jgi:hypothetical protein
VVSVNAPEVYVVLVLTISFQSVPLVELCHFATEPILPERVSSPLVFPEQMVVLPAIVPPTDAGDTVTVAVTELAAEQAPLVITAR